MLDIDKEKYPYCASGYQYACDVREGKYVVNIHVKNCIKRFFSDLSDENSEYYFCLDSAEKYLNRVQRFRHVKGANWKTPTITYEPWQNFVFMYLMGFMRKSTNRRRFRTAYMEVGRGNAKSAMSSQAGLYFLSMDGELGPEVVCAATKKDQARIVFDDSRRMALKNPKFLKATGTRVLMHSILHNKSGGIMKPLASDTSSMDGLNPSLIIGDEIHEWKRTLYDVLDSSLTKRDDSLFLMISTAGLSTEGIGHEIHSYTAKVLSGDIEDDTWFGIIYSKDKDDDWLDPNTWLKANPNWGVSVDPINFEAKAKKAQETPAAKYSFLVKHLNEWQNTASPFFSLKHWDDCADPSIKIENFTGHTLFTGLDLSQKIDLCCIFHIFKEKGSVDKPIYYLFDRSYIPEARVMDDRNTSYAKWVEQGWLNAMPGEVIDFETIQNQIIEDAKKYNAIGIHADPWSANETLQKLVKARLEAYDFRMNTGNMSEPMKKLDALIREKRIRHNGSPLLRWCLGNVVAKEDANGNVFPRKEHERLKIDLIVAAIMALAGHIKDEEKLSVYEDRGMRFI